MVWYHGSPVQLTVLRAGSSITEDPAIARAFSHRPQFVSVDDEGRSVKHTGTSPGYLYEVIDEIAPDDVHPHPHPVNAARWEWLTTREVRVRLVERTTPRPEDMLTAEELTELQRRVELSGQSGSALLDDPPGPAG